MASGWWRPYDVKGTTHDGISLHTVVPFLVAGKSNLSVSFADSSPMRRATNRGQRTAACKRPRGAHTSHEPLFINKFDEIWFPRSGSRFRPVAIADDAVADADEVFRQAPFFEEGFPFGRFEFFFGPVDPA